jgi:hypothetical protein
LALPFFSAATISRCSLHSWLPRAGQAFGVVRLRKSLGGFLVSAT